MHKEVQIKHDLMTRKKSRNKQLVWENEQCLYRFYLL